MGRKCWKRQGNGPSAQSLPEGGSPGTGLWGWSLSSAPLNGQVMKLSYFVPLSWW